MEFVRTVEPTKEQEYILLNPETLEYDNRYYKVNCPRRSVYFTQDPRLISSSRGGDPLPLDLPPINQGVKIKNVYTDLGFNNTIYKDYSAIRSGDIMYYIDKSIAGAYYRPVFVNPSFVTGYDYIDPMGSVKPTYTRTPVHHENPLDVKANTYKTGLSFLDQTSEFREDIIAKQQSVHNQQKYSARYYS
jgi:hypothetical protein